MVIKYLKRQVANKSGQAMVEFVIIMPVLLLLFIAIIFLGRAYLIKANTYTAARYYTWNEGRGAGVNSDKLNELFFQGDPSKITIEDADPHSIAGFDNDALTTISEIFDILSGTTRKKVTYALGPIPFRGGEVKISSSHYVDIDPWKGMSPAALTLLGIGVVWGYAVDPAKVPPCPADVGSLVGDLVAKVLGEAGRQGLTQVIETALTELRDEISNYATDFIQDKFINELESTITDEAEKQLDGVVEGIKGAALDQLSGFIGEAGGQVSSINQ
ncbi:MAG: pilus assembly protein [Deltaproteobacteria bacterium]|nr:MAG: pilus assembly protein [Deltaproteobacteria bacterium]